MCVPFNCSCVLIHFFFSYFLTVFWFMYMSACCITKDLIECKYKTFLCALIKWFFFINKDTDDFIKKNTILFSNRTITIHRNEIYIYIQIYTSRLNSRLGRHLESSTDLASLLPMIATSLNQ